MARVAAEIGATVVALVAEGDREIAPLAAETIALPEVPELLSPIVAVVPLQLLTYHLAVRAGANPDTVRVADPRTAGRGLPSSRERTQAARACGAQLLRATLSRPFGGASCSRCAPRLPSAAPCSAPRS